MHGTFVGCRAPSSPLEREEGDQDYVGLPKVSMQYHHGAKINVLPILVSLETQNV